MKLTSTTLVAVVSLFSQTSLAQLSNGGLYANFGVDADTRNNYMKYGLTTGAVVSDDWFSPLSANSIIDTSNAAYYLGLLQSGANVSFSKRMSVPLYSKMNGTLWLDAAYGRDYTAASSTKDSTTFLSACKNGDNPSTWNGGTSSFPNKNDLIDVYAHMRRDGLTVHDSLWLFTGVSTYGTTGSAYYDIELYKNSFSYDQPTGVFTTAGPDAGHTQWLFDASGNLIQTGDMILAVNFTPGSPPVVDVRIWVSQTTWSTVTPAYFSFNANFNGSSASFGYASIVSKSGATAFGAGISNYSATPAQDTTAAAPWGTHSTLGWSTQYQSQQLIEIGVNLTRIGVDPTLYTALGTSGCQSLFSNIFFKSRASNSFTSNLKDFVTPLVFLRTPVMDYSLQPDTLRCNRTDGTIRITNNSTAGYYTWHTAGGGIIGASTDSSQITIDKPGTYIVSASPAAGCAATRTDTVVIPIDTMRPVASVMITMPVVNAYLQLYGGDTAASDYMTPFGRSQGLLWNWTGPEGFTSTIQNPRTADTAWGTYQLVVTEKRNGCTDTAEAAISLYDFTVLSTDDLILTGHYADHVIALSWTDALQNAATSYTIERMAADNVFIGIGTMTNSGGGGVLPSPGALTFIDAHPRNGSNTYRIMAMAGNGRSYYSRITTINVNAADRPAIYLAGNAPGSATALIANSNADCRAVMVLYSPLGQVLDKRIIQLYKGSNSIDLPEINGQPLRAGIVSLFVNGQLAYTQKMIH